MSLADLHCSRCGEGPVERGNTVGQAWFKCSNGHKWYPRPLYIRAATTPPETKPKQRRMGLWAKLVDKKVVPCTAEEWAKGFEDTDKRVVEQTLFGSPIVRTKTWFGKTKEVTDVNMVSTVFLGLNSGFGGKDLWFETMSYIDGEWEDQYRYGTWEEAVRGHKRVVREVEKRLKIPGRPAGEVESQMIQTVLTQLGRRKIEV